MISIARSSFKPLYLQISDSIREEIETGKIMPGQKIWSERELMQELNVSRNTAQQAIEELVRNGFVSRVQGKGTFAIERKVSYGLQRMSSFSEEMMGSALAGANASPTASKSTIAAASTRATLRKIDACAISLRILLLLEVKLPMSVGP
jgi:GntR family transcriptional regulator